MRELPRFLFPFAARKPSPRDRYAGYYERVLASCVDLALVFFLLYDPFFWLGHVLYGEHSPDQVLAGISGLSWQEALRFYTSGEMLPRVVLNYALQLAILGAVIVGSEYYFHTTPGRWLIGLKLVDAKTEARPSLFQLIRRYLGYFVSLPPLMLGYLWCNWDERRQTWHDKIAGTVVLDTRPRGWYWAQVKRLYRKLRGLPPAENAVGQPAEPERHGDA